MEIKRDKYVDKLVRHKGNGMIKIITGNRIKTGNKQHP